MTAVRRWLPAVLALLLVAAAALLVVGVSLERGDRDAAAATRSGEVGPDESTGEGEAAGHTGAAAAEAPLGLPLESTGAVAALVVGSLALAAAVWRRPVRLVLGVVAAFAIVAGVLDVTEASHQLDDSHTGLAALAGAIATTRVLVVLGAGWLWRTADGR
jgi:hypothetical protein